MEFVASFIASGRLGVLVIREQNDIDEILTIIISETESHLLDLRLNMDEVAGTDTAHFKALNELQINGLKYRSED